jgi:predicted transposase YdaD
MVRLTGKKASLGARRRRADLKGFQEEGQAHFGTSETRFEAVMQAAERCGLLKEKSSRIAGRVSAALIEEAKRRTGIESDTDLIEFALANLALEDKFAEAFRAAHGKVDPDLKLGY